MEDPVVELERTWEVCQRIAFSSDRATLERDLLEPIACLLGAEAAVFRVFSLDSPKPTLLVGLGMADAVHDAYLNRYFKLDPIQDLLAGRFGGPLFADSGTPGRWVDGCGTTTRERRVSNASMIARYQASFRQYRAKFLSPYNLRHHLGFCFQDAAADRTFVLNFIRGRESCAFDRLEFARTRIVGTLLHARVTQLSWGRSDDEEATGSPHCVRESITDEDRRLSARELEVAEAVARGLTNKEVGEALNISVRTVENHLRSIFAKLKINTRTRLAARLHQVKPAALLTQRTVV
jgi:DNA-binding CsgD family transcriptional regulator